MPIHCWIKGTAELCLTQNSHTPFSNAGALNPHDPFRVDTIEKDADPYRNRRWYRASALRKVNEGFDFCSGARQKNSSTGNGACLGVASIIRAKFFT